MIIPSATPSPSPRCRCSSRHLPRRIVLTGGPGAGKTAVLGMLAHLVCEHVILVPESAGILFGGGFPRRNDAVTRRAAQRAIYRVQLELEAIAEAGNPALIVCDRGVVDGYAYWPDDADSYWAGVGTTRAAALGRYDAVIHLQTPDGANGYDHRNPVRIESVAEAHEIDGRIALAWQGHPRQLVIDATSDFLTKAQRALDVILGEVPACCRTVAARERLQRASETTSTGQFAP